MALHVFRAALTAAAISACCAAAPCGAADLGGAEAKAFFNAKGCNACHGLDEARIGPSYRIVAMRYATAYRAQPSVQVGLLAAKIRYGGAGAWGMVPMISNPRLSQAEAESIARWILGQAPAAN